MIKITNKELIQELIGEIKDFPRYTTQLINLANQNAQGTRPRVVGQLSELINECPEKTYEGWKNWYLKKYPTAVNNATEKIDEMVNNLRGAINLIDKSIIKNTTYKFANPKEESRGIDGFVGNNPVSIKPTTYKIKKFLREEIKTKIIFYTKTKTGLEIDADEILK